AGHQMAFERQKHQEELAKEKFSQELQTKKYQEDIRQFNEQAKRVQEQFTAEQTIRESQNKLAELSARQNIVENYQKGIATPGLTERPYSSTDISQNITPGISSTNVSPGRIFTQDVIAQPNTVTVSHPDLGTFNIPISTEDAQLYGVPAGTLHKDITGKTPGVKLSSAQEDKLTYLKSMLQDAVDAKQLLDPNYGGVGYDKYFLGRGGLLGLASGLGTEQLAKFKGESDETQAMIRNKLGSVFDKRKVESAGKVLNAAELKLLQNYVPPYEHTLNPTQAKTNLDAFITGTSQLVKDLESQYANRVVTPGGKTPTGAGTLDLNKFIISRKPK